MYVLLAALLAVSYLYFLHAGGGWNVMTRLALVRAVFHQHQLMLDPRAAATTGDKAEYPPGSGDYYCDKPIGAQLLALPGYALGFTLFYAAGASPALALGAGTIGATWTASGLPAVVLGLVFLALSGCFADSLTVRVTATLLYCLGTLAWTYATLLFGHQLAAVAGFCALAAAHWATTTPRRPGFWAALAGALAGLAVITEFPAAVVYLAVGAFLVVGAGWRRALPYVAGSLPFLALQLAYNWACFDHPLNFGYEYEATPAFGDAARWVSWPRPTVAALLLFSPNKGLFVFSPYLALAAAGLILAARRQGPARRLAITCLGIFLAYLLYNAGHYMWWGGSCLGPRHLVASLPFLAFGLVFLLPRLSGPWIIVLAAAGTWSVAVAWLGAATVSEPGPAVADANILMVAVAQLLSGALDWPNFGLSLGLKGAASLLPQLLVGTGLAAALLAAARRTDRARESRGAERAG